MKLAYLALAAIAVAAPAVAQSNIIAVYDANGDGALSREEFTAMQADAFAALDADGNGLVTRADVAAAAAAQGRKADGSRFMSRDANGDGAVSEAEFLQGKQGFDRADRNGNGIIDARELQRVTAALARIQG
ncbi:signal transduction protein [Poseidonocella sp. HB161398]|uniref:signal transduction protein n=1 Tax=Poseidonocella sp. HB161398 TaxID=2320855 RepID=UPI001485D9E3|nr:signal transduction protein [Poseidonocella sp. HB161398]